MRKAQNRCDGSPIACAQYSKSPVPMFPPRPFRRATARTKRGFRRVPADGQCAGVHGTAHFHSISPPFGREPARQGTSLPRPRFAGNHAIRVSFRRGNHPHVPCVCLERGGGMGMPTERGDIKVIWACVRDFASRHKANTRTLSFEGHFLPQINRSREEPPLCPCGGQGDP